MRQKNKRRKTGDVVKKTRVFKRPKHFFWEVGKGKDGSAEGEGAILHGCKDDGDQFFLPFLSL